MNLVVLKHLRTEFWLLAATVVLLNSPKPISGMFFAYYFREDLGRWPLYFFSSHAFPSLMHVILELVVAGMLIEALMHLRSNRQILEKIKSRLRDRIEEV